MNIGYYIMPPMNFAQSRKKGVEMGFNALYDIDEAGDPNK